MINVYIYLDSKKDARLLIKGLMEGELVAHASIDKDNSSFVKEGKEVKEQSSFVITAQTRALLFDQITTFIHRNYEGNIKIYSLPITQCNENFSEEIRLKTKKV